MAIENLTLPVGRIVQGHPMELHDKKNFITKKVELKEDGTPKQVASFKIAIPKAEFETAVYPYLAQEAMRIIPSAGSVHPSQYHKDGSLAWRVVDGDSPDFPQGSKVAYNTREGYPGHYIISFDPSYPVDSYCFMNGKHERITKDFYKTGDYVQVNVKLVGNPGVKPAIYWNPNGLSFIKQGEAIRQTANPDTMFGATPAIMPTLPQAPFVAPMSAPVGMPAPAPMSAPVGMPAPAPMGAPVGMPAPAPMGAPVGMPAPAYDFVQNQGFSQPAAPVAFQQQGVTQQGGTFAMPATTFPTNR